MRAFTPRDQKGVKAAAETFRQNPEIDVEAAITELGVGEALVSFLDEKGTPTVVERSFIIPPQSQIGPVSPQQRQQLIASSLVAGQYETMIDRESAYELLKTKAEQAAQEQAEQEEQKAAEKAAKEEARASKTRGDTPMSAFAKSAARAIGSNVGRQIVRGVLGSIFGGGTSKKKSSWW